MQENIPKMIDVKMAFLTKSQKQQEQKELLKGFAVLWDL